MRWSFATIVLADGPPADARRRREAFAWAAAAGFAGVELSPRWCDLHTPTLAAEVADAGLVVSGLNLNRVLPVACPQAAAHRDQMRRAVDAAEALGAEVVNVSLSRPRTADGRRPMRGDEVPPAAVDEAVGFVAGLGGRVVVELHDDGLLDTADRCRAFAGRAGVRVNPDLGNVCRGPGPGPDWRAALHKLAPLAGCWHVKNYRAGELVPLADGDIDFREAAQVMRAAGFTGWVSVEGYVGDVRGYQQNALAFLRAAVSA